MLYQIQQKPIFHFKGRFNQKWDIQRRNESRNESRICDIIFNRSGEALMASGSSWRGGSRTVRGVAPCRWAAPRLGRCQGHLRRPNHSLDGVGAFNMLMLNAAPFAGGDAAPSRRRRRRVKIILLASSCFEMMRDGRLAV